MSSKQYSLPEQRRVPPLVYHILQRRGVEMSKEKCQKAKCRKEKYADIAIAMGYVLSKIQTWMTWLLLPFTNYAAVPFVIMDNQANIEAENSSNKDVGADLLALVPPISVFTNSSPLLEEKSIRDLSRDSATFMWFQLLIETLTRMPLSKLAKEELLNECRQQYCGNASELEKIAQFDIDCSPSNSIRWYTRDCFLFRLLNQAFRTENIDEIMKFRFFIRQLNEQLSLLHKDYVDMLRSNEFDSMTVYRGQSMTSDELQKIRENIGGLISFNTFLSTAIEKQIAETYAGDGSRQPDYFSVLFEITIDFGNTRAFADITRHSYMKDENEVLCSMGSVFRVVSVEDSSDRKLTTVKLISSKEEDEHLIHLIDHLKKQMDQSTNLLTLGAILKDMGDYDRAELYFRIMLQESIVGEDQMELAELYNNLGTVLSNKGDHKSGFETYNKALDIYLKDGVKPRPSVFASLYNNMGQVCFELGEYEEALKAYTVALNTMTEYVNGDHPGFGTIYTNMSLLYSTCGKYAAAIEYIDKTLELEQRILPKYHPSLGSAYNHKGHALMCLKDHRSAITNYEKAWEIEQKCLPPFHPNLATTQNNIGACYYYTDQNQAALQHFEQALKILANASHTANDILAKTYSNIGILYEKSGQDEIALKYCQKAHDILVEILSENDPCLATSYNNLGLAQYRNNQLDLALENFHKSLLIFSQTLPADDRQIVQVQHNIYHINIDIADREK